MSTIYRHLLLKRIENNLSQNQLAAKMGISQAAISKYESGESLPNFAALKAYKKVLKIDVNELLELRRF